MRTAAVSMLAMLALFELGSSNGVGGSIIHHGRRQSFLGADVDRVAEECCTSHIGEASSYDNNKNNASEKENATECCANAVRLARPLQQHCQYRLLSFLVAMDVVHCVDAELHRSGRQFTDFGCCMSVYKYGIDDEGHHCLHQCEAAYTTATSKEAFLASVKSCRLHNPVFPCFEACIAKGADHFHAATCLAEYLPELWDE